jgi:hypothetical protein
VMPKGSYPRNHLGGPQLQNAARGTYDGMTYPEYERAAAERHRTTVRECQAEVCAGCNHVFQPWDVRGGVHGDLCRRCV